MRKHFGKIVGALACLVLVFQCAVLIDVTETRKTETAAMQSRIDRLAADSARFHADGWQTIHLELAPGDTATDWQSKTFRFVVAGAPPAGSGE